MHVGVPPAVPAQVARAEVAAPDDGLATVGEEDFLVGSIQELARKQLTIRRQIISDAHPAILKDADGGGSGDELLEDRIQDHGGGNQGEGKMFAMPQ